MKKLIFLVLIFCSFISFSQTKTEMKSEIESLKMQVETLTNEVKVQKSENEQLKSLMISKLDEVSNSIKTFKGSSGIQALKTDTINKSQSAGRCKATTQAGTQCKRLAMEGNNFCWQHQGSAATKSTVKSSSSSSGSNGAIQTGSRGGQYYINKNGNKTYIKRK